MVPGSQAPQDKTRQDKGARTVLSDRPQRQQLDDLLVNEVEVSSRNGKLFDVRGLLTLGSRKVRYCRGTSHVTFAQRHSLVLTNQYLPQ